MKSDDKDLLEDLYPSDVVNRWKRWHSKPWYMRLIDAIKNFFATLRGDIEDDD